MRSGGEKAASEGDRQRLDRQLTAAMARVQDGDRAAYDFVLRQSVPHIRRTARGRGTPPDLIDDVVQDVLVTVHGARSAFDPDRSFLAWLTVITQRRSIDLMRKRWRRGALETHAPLAYDAYPAADDPAGDAERASEARQLRDAIETLSPVQREAVRALALEQSSLEDASMATGRTKAALKVNLHRAIASLRARLRPQPEKEKPAGGDAGKLK
jgi:RNA polymerase sigma-70 factor (ECF subfamily)